MAAPIIAAGVAAAATGGQIYAQGRMNKKTREWSEKMYGKSRQDALDDATRANEYNSPKAQMARWKEAGLNPNLMYGQSTESVNVRAPETPSWNPQAPDIQGSANSGIRAYQDFTLQDEQVKLIRQQRENLAVDNILKTLNVDKSLVNNHVLRETAMSVINQQYQKAINMEMDGKFKINEEDRKAATHAASLENLLLDAANKKTNNQKMIQEIENAKNKGILDKLEIKLREQGLSYGDNVILRIISRIATEDISLSEILGNLWKNVTK